MKPPAPAAPVALLPSTCHASGVIPARMVELRNENATCGWVAPLKSDWRLL
jgi:hypothetical protein